LSLSNEPEKLANMALDTLSQVLGVDCCWIQTIADKKQKKLTLAAERGFSPEIRREIAGMDMGHVFSEQVIGLGHIITIPDLSNDGLYGIPSFRNTGFKWLVAVPLMTYRAHGILGAASRDRKLLHKDTPDLIMTIAGLIAAALMKADLSKSAPEPERPVSDPTPELKKETAPEITLEETIIVVKPDRTLANQPAKHADGAFHSHAKKMEVFRRSHG
jgi:transcriptional regulator with GAF, ATPase, and Fis domain